MTFDILDAVRKAQAGDRDAFGTVIRHFEPTVFAIVLRRLRNRSEAREVTQDVFLRAVRKIDQLQEPAAFPGWIKQIAVRTAINRAVRRGPETPSAPENFGSLAEGDDLGPQSCAIDAERRAKLRDGLTRLGATDRSTLEAFYFDGQSLREMSERFDCPVGTIKRRLHTARARLKDELLDLQPA